MLQEGDWLGAMPGSCVQSSSVTVAAVPDEFSRSPTGETCPSISGAYVVPVFQQWLADVAAPPSPCAPPSYIPSTHLFVQLGFIWREWYVVENEEDTHRG